MKIESPLPSFIQLHEFTLLAVDGADAASFLHRLSTNHIENLEATESRPTCFLDQRGRLVSFGYVLRLKKDEFKVVIPYKTTRLLADWLSQFLFTEDVTIRDLTNVSALAIAIGPEPHGFRGPDFHFQHVTVPSYFLLLPEGSITILDSKRLNATEFEALRIAGQVPLSESEFNTNFNPLQLGLGDTIHWAKGCYIGQEVVSRLESQAKHAKTLFGAFVREADLALVKPGEAVHGEQGVAGVVTSVAPMSLAGEANILVVLKREHVFSHGITELSKVRIDSLRQDA